ncbi:hypothetical protein DFH06DRAFT_1130310 [Mycena polygramma]|nr:hypothetical protein DFH06DRAFT_1130310 [Mycena polygramma]
MSDIGQKQAVIDGELNGRKDTGEPDLKLLTCRSIQAEPQFDNKSMIEGKTFLGDEPERRARATDLKICLFIERIRKQEPERFKHACLQLARGKGREEKRGPGCNAAHGQLIDRKGGPCNFAVVENIAALRGHPARFAQPAVTEKQEDGDPIKPPYITLEGANEVVVKQREQRE